MGDAALSVLKAKTFSTLLWKEASITFTAPCTLVLIVSKGLYSAVSTCLRAAACITISTLFNAVINLSLSLTSPIKILFFSYFF